MKQTLQLKVGQQLAMTPQLQQAIRLLQLSSLELRTEVQETLETNPMLDVDEEAEQEASAESQGEENLTAQAESKENGETVNGHDTDRFAEEYSGAWGAAGFGVADDDDRDFFSTRSSGGDSLQDHLLEQLHLSPLGPVDRQIGMTLIEAIRDDGYLSEGLDDIQATLAHDGIEASEDEIEAVLHLVQSFDPPGIAARDPGECMDLQLVALPEETPNRDLARRIVTQHLDRLAGHDIDGLRRALGVDEDELRQAVELIRSLDPHPGSRITDSSPQYVVPDVFVRKENGIWRVRLNPEVAPRLRVNPLYSGMVRRADNSADNAFMREHLQEARWFIKSLESRNDTLLKVATAITERQRAFLDYGEEAMKPLVLRDIAEALEMHESTISRVTTEKYMHTPRGIFEFKYFFSSHVSTAEGGECSATAIRAMVKKLVAGEDRRKPLSDHRIAGILGERGINVARRTVAKYRESMAIPPSNERKRLM